MCLMQGQVSFSVEIIETYGLQGERESEDA